MKRNSLYWQLLHSEAMLRQLQQETCLGRFCQLLRGFWQLPLMTDDEVLATLSSGNKAPVEPDFGLFCAFWSPALYDAGRKQLSWIPAEDKPDSPFYTEHITRLKGQLLAALVQPKTLLAVILNWTDFLPNVTPSGFIFHVSRCGSTLVSQSFAALAQCRVLSESPLLTQVLLDSNLSETEKAKTLRLCINLQGRLYGSERHLIIKWNAWDLQFWPLIQKQYQNVTVLLLVRDPVEILASHQKSAGFHMVKLHHFDLFPELVGAAELPILEYRSAVLQLLLKYCLVISTSRHVLMVDYSELLPAICEKIADWFALDLSAQDKISCRQSQRVYSKNPGQLFEPDKKEKQSLFTEQEKVLIQRYCLDLYLKCL